MKFVQGKHEEERVKKVNKGQAESYMCMTRTLATQ